MLSVFNTAEFRRVRDLPRRPHDWAPEALTTAVWEVTAHLRRPGGTHTLFPIQARSLCEAGEVGRFVGELSASAGKTYISFCLPVVWGALRTLLMVPAKLREQTIIEYRKAQRQWNLPALTLDGKPPPGTLADLPGAAGEVRILSYEKLSVAAHAGFLEEYDPDVIVADEAHALARLGAARSRRLFRFLKEKRRRLGFDSVRFAPMSGTMRRKSLRECVHLYLAALGDQAPVPDHWPDVEQWSCAMDRVPEAERIAPGALLAFCTEEEARTLAGLAPGSEEALEIIRSAYRRRVVETAGVVATAELYEGAALEIRVRPLVVPDTVREQMRRLRRDGVLPSGDTVDSPLSLWAHAREIAGGFAYRWDPPAPEPWKKARKAWNAYVLSILEENRPGLDSPLQVARWVSQGHAGAVPEYEAWVAIRDTFKPNPVPLWIDRFMFQDAERWALSTGGIVWVQHASAVYRDGSAVDGLSDDQLGSVFKQIPYFGSGKAGEGIRDYKGPCAASLRAHGTGKNLVQWDQALMLTLPSSGATLEQLLARSHREGQKAKKVVYHFYLRAKEDHTALQTVVADARYVQAITGQPQRILAVLDRGGIRGWTEDLDVSTLKVTPDDPMWG